MDIRTSK